jgi:aminoglycoside 6'-N-acetyltransferase
LAAFEPDRHLPLLAAWLSQPHVARWWGDAVAVLAEIRAHPVATAAIIEADGQPVGYLCWQTPSRAELTAAGLADLPADLVDIDLMIGLADRLGCGIGPQALAQLCLRLQDQGASTVGLGTATANRRALRAFEKAGFRPYRDFEEAGVGMRYLTRHLTPPSG